MVPESKVFFGQSLLALAQALQLLNAGAQVFSDAQYTAKPEIINEI
jgi:hypothetical protein